MKPVLENTAYSQDRHSLNIFSLETEKFEPYWHYHSEIEIVLIKSGFGTRYLGGNIEHFNSPELVILGSGIPHQWVSAENSPTCRAIVIHFHRDLFEHIPSCHSILSFLDKSKTGMYFEPSPHIIQLFENAVDNESCLQFSFLIGMLSYLKEIETRTLTAPILSNQKTRKAQMDKTNKIVEHIMLNLDRPISLNEVADIAHLSRPSFCRWFKGATGNTFVNFLNLTRVEKAGQLLINSEDLISQICFSSGFESISQFNRAFKNFKGVSPREYRSKFK